MGRTITNINLASISLPLVSIFTIILSASQNVNSANIASSLVWGPGLDAKIVVPARHIFVQIVDNNGNNITHSVGNVIKASVVKNSNKRHRTFVEVLDRHDGSYVVRYKLHESSSDEDLKIILTDLNGKSIADSPYILKAPVYNDACDCPEPDLDVWLKSMNCPAMYKQIERDLSNFKDIDMRKVEKDIIYKFASQPGSHSLCHYAIKNNKIYRRTFGQHVGFKMFSDALLLSMTRKTRLPDMEFFMNLGDWPLVKQKAGKALPLVSWCGSEETLDIILPTYDLTQATLEMMGRQSLDVLSVQANTGPKWENKTEVAFFRGRDSRRERLDLVRLSQKHPDQIDAKLTNMFFFKDKMEEMGGITKRISFFDFFQYKYQINIDGTVAAYRFPYLLVGNSLVMKQDSIYYEHFYKDLQPNEHYIPIKHDLSDLMEQIKWAKEHDDEAQRIAKNGQEYARNNLMPEDIFCYHAVFFKEYANLLSSDIVVHADMELVTQPADAMNKPCRCHRDKVKDEL